MRYLLTIALLFATGCRTAGPSVMVRIQDSPGCTVTVPVSGTRTDADQGKVVSTDATVKAIP